MATVQRNTDAPPARDDAWPNDARAAQLAPQGAVLARDGSREPVTEFLLVPFGEVRVERPRAGRSFTFTRQQAESAVTWFAQLGRKLAIDYEHQSLDAFNTRSDGLRPAAGWIGGLEVRGDGLWAVDVAWTDRAATLLRSGEYRYFSPVIFWRDEEYTELVGLGPVALTNDPAMANVAPLAAGRATDDRVNEARLALSAYRRQLDDAQQRIAQLERQLSAQDADHFIERGMQLGKILDATSMDWREDYLRDAQAAEARLARAPVLLPPGRIVSVDGSGAPRVLSASGNTDPAALARLGAEAEDLQAYERAVQAGRVTQF